MKNTTSDKLQIILNISCIVITFAAILLLMVFFFVKAITIEKPLSTVETNQPETVIVYETVPIEVIKKETEYIYEYDTEYVFIDLIPEDYDWYKKKYAELAAILQQKQEIPDVDILPTPYGSEYPIAEQVWVYLTQQLHYNDYVAAAIIGNMMVECGGMSLNLDWECLFKEEYYGLCQWALRYYPDIHGKSVLTQLEYLYKSMPYEFKTFGKLYKRGFTLEDFLAMEDCREAALAFAKIYERCGEGSYTKRKDCAEKAYDFFTKLRAEMGD